MSTAKTADTSAPKPAEKPPTIDYALAEDGKVTRTDKDSTIHVATLTEDGTLILEREWTKFRAPVVAFLNVSDRTPKAIILEGDEDKKPKENIPPMPKKSLRLGDKTPQIIEWYRKYKPAEYKARYGIKGEGTVTKHRKATDPNTGKVTSEPYQVDAILAERKIPDTEKLEANESSLNESEYED
jgi:hypothetical protein